MADDLTPIPPPEEPPEPPLAQRPPPPPPVAERQHGALYTHRFGLAYAALAVVVGLAVGGFIVLAGRASEGSGPAWSSWKPSEDGTDGALEIASHVSSKYRLEDGGKLVGVFAGTPNVQNVPIGHYALVKDAVTNDYSMVSADNSIEYQLCGFGQACAIKTGAPTVERGRLLHRQALELALYSFKYLDVKSVVTLLPPQKGQQATFALFFRKDDLKQELSRPLRQTLPPKPNLTPQNIGQREIERITTLTSDHLFQYTFQQAPDRTVVLVLQPYSA